MGARHASGVAHGQCPVGGLRGMGAPIIGARGPMLHLSTSSRGTLPGPDDGSVLPKRRLLLLFGGGYIWWRIYFSCSACVDIRFRRSALGTSRAAGDFFMS